MTATFALVGGTVLTPFREIEEGAVVVRDCYIVKVGKHIGVRGKKIDVREMYIVPGFVDLHLHGGGGHDVMEGAEEAIAAISVAHARGGTTSFLATTVTAPWERIHKALAAIGEVVKAPPQGAEVLGAHLEGPWLNPSQAGAQAEEYMEHPNPMVLHKLLDEYPFVHRISLAPELPGALECGRVAAKRGILVAIAHSDATYLDTVAAVEAGFRHVTHLFSGCSGVRRIDAYRFAGVVEAALLLDSLTVELIADGHHLPPSLIRLVLKAKGLNRTCVITDAMAAAGLGPGRYKLGDREVVVERDVPPGYEALPSGYVAKLPDGSAFAGSAALMIELVANLVRNVKLPLADAVRLASTNPATILGLQDRGILAPGCRADIVVFDKEFRVRLTLVKGEVVYNGL